MLDQHFDIQSDFEADLEQLTRYAMPGDQEVAKQALRLCQSVKGAVSEHDLTLISNALDLNPKVLNLLMRMMPSIKKIGLEHEFIVCSGRCCSQKGSLNFLKFLSKELEAEPNHISKDGRFALKTQNCFKACAKAPNVRIDGVLESGMTELKLKKIVSTFKKSK